MTSRDGGPIPGILSEADLRRVQEQFGVLPSQVRRDHAISHVLAAIARMDAADDLVFFGGTALARTLLPSLRLSEDIDLIARTRRSDCAQRIERAIDDGLRRSHGEVGWQPRLTETRGPDSAVLGLGGSIDIRIQLLGSTGYPAWPTEQLPLEQRYADAPPAVLSVLTPPAFAASKAMAWADRRASRDLYDLWGLAADGHIEEAAADLLRRHGPTTRPGAARIFAVAPSASDWSAALDHQCIVQVGPTEALDRVRQAWADALAAN
jgi:predicted nucleotidyltransferase component of viral defense system